MSFIKAQTGVGVNPNSGVSSTTWSLSLTNTPKPGNVIIASMTVYPDITTTTTVSSAQDGNGNPFTVLATPGFVTGAGQSFLMYLIAPSNVHKTLTIVFANTSVGALWLNEFSPVTGMVKAHTSNTATGTGTAVSLPILNISTYSELLVSVCSYATNVLTVNSPWVLSDVGLIRGCASAHFLNANRDTGPSFTGDSGSSVWGTAAASFQSTTPSFVPISHRPAPFKPGLAR